MHASMWRWDFGKAVMGWAVILISEESMQRWGRDELLVGSTVSTFPTVYEFFDLLPP